VILADTSAWIEYHRATGSPTDRRIHLLIKNDDLLAVTEPVLMEIIAGARDDTDASRLRRLLSRFALLTFDSAVDFDGAAAIYRRCRSAGVTPRGMLDCMIATVAWRHRASLLTIDADLVRVAGVIGIELDEAAGSR
jgi:predicted nucleic acid-binding protein